jgi:hypothetical protein
MQSTLSLDIVELLVRERLQQAANDALARQAVAARRAAAANRTIGRSSTALEGLRVGLAHALFGLALCLDI